MQHIGYEASTMNHHEILLSMWNKYSVIETHLDEYADREIDDRSKRTMKEMKQINDYDILFEQYLTDDHR
jgi:AICAR transformylase/IMP cyclohydrolase PurH